MYLCIENESVLSNLNCLLNSLSITFTTHLYVNLLLFTEALADEF